MNLGKVEHSEMKARDVSNFENPLSLQEEEHEEISNNEEETNR